MSTAAFTKGPLYPCNPVTERGISTKLDISKEKLVYANGRTVIIRDLKDPSIATAYSGHTKNVTVARISPSGYYCASADIQGTVRIWDTVGEDNLLKAEVKAISGRINDLSWDSESKRIIAVGDAKEKFGHAFMFDSGTSTGEIIGHSRAINAVSIRNQRPFKAATAGDDALIVFHHGVPFKYDKTIKTHTKFVQDVKYSHSGDHFASVGSDSKIFIYDGKTGDTLGEFSADDGHKGSIMACSWSPDDKTLVTSAADCTVKLWDVETRKATQTWSLGSGPLNQQVGNAWSPAGDIISLSTSGDLNVFDQRTADKPARIFKGPTKSITAGTLTPSGTFLTGSSDGRVTAFSSNGEPSYLDGTGHANLVNGLATRNNTVYSVGYDDTLREIELDSKMFNAGSSTLASQPKSIAVATDGSVFIVEQNVVEVYRSNQKLTELSTPYEASCVATSEEYVAVGGEDNNVYLYTWDGKALSEAGTLDGCRSAVSALAFTADGATLAAGGTNGRIVLFNVKEKKATESRWTWHSGRISSLAWTSDGVNLASGSLDTHIYIWSVKKPMSNIPIKNAIPGGVTTIAWIFDSEKRGKLISAGADACVRTWNITFKG